MNTNPSATRILIYGDSITWGRIANTPYRHDAQTRFTGVVQEVLGSDYEIIEEGLRGRMAYGENPYQENKNGWAQFVPIYLSHLPIDLLIVFLGTNDSNDKSDKRGVQLASELHLYIDKAWALSKAQEMEKPKVVLVSPPIVNETVLKPNTMFSGATQRMSDYASEIEKTVNNKEIYMFDTNRVIRTCVEDGVHLDKEANLILGKQLATFIKEVVQR